MRSVVYIQMADKQHDLATTSGGRAVFARKTVNIRTWLEVTSEEWLWIVYNRSAHEFKADQASQLDALEEDMKQDTEREDLGRS